MARRTVQGYLDMGRIRIPGLPQGIVLTDRDNGTLWLLSYTTDPPAGDGLGYFTITDTIPANMERYTYAAYDEPIFDEDIRLLVRGGYLGYELTPSPNYTEGNTQPIMARRGNARVFREVMVPDTWNKEGDMLAWQDTEV